MKSSIIRNGLIAFGLVVILAAATPAYGLFSVHQRTGATGVALACAGLIESVGRNPSEEATLQGLYDDGLAIILGFNHTSYPRDVAEAIGIVRGSLILSVSRNPSIKTTLEDIAGECEGDILGFL